MARPVCLAIAVALMPAALGAQQQGNTSPALYTRVGGYDVLARLVDTAFPRVAAHPQLRRLFQGHSRDSQIRQRQLIIDALCRATGGPCAYLGRDLTTVHVGLGITDADWGVFIRIIGAALTELSIPPGARTDLLELFEQTLRPTVVVGR